MAHLGPGDGGDDVEPHCAPHLMVNPELFAAGEYEGQSELAHQLIGRSGRG
jgi:hypothetical protein